MQHRANHTGDARYRDGVRIVSLLPSATEMLFELGVGDQVVAVTHECDHPEEARSLPAVTRDLLAAGLTPAEIDAAVRASVHDVHTIYQLDVDRLRASEPDVIVTQDLCEVCAVPTSEVEEAVCSMPRQARIVAADPHRLDDLFVALAEIGHAVNAERTSLVIDRLARRLATVRLATRRLAHPRVAVLEWPDPPFAPGHWVPEMVEAAGGHNVLGTPGTKSVPIPWPDVATVEPDVVLLAFCGFDLVRTEDEWEAIADRPEAAALVTGARVLATDGSAYFSRPGPRLIDGVEALAYGLHDLEAFRPPPGRIAERTRDGRWVDLGG